MTSRAEGSPVVSVVVPTRDRPAELRRCLAALSRQSSAEPYEVVVVDDGSADAEAVATEVGAIPCARLVRLGHQGYGAARNAGTHAAHGSFICFTDDDCEPAPDWLSRLTAPWAEGARVVAGPTVVGPPRQAAAIASQLIADALSERGRVPFAATSNVGCDARLAREVPFDSGFRYASEDRDWCVRLAMAGQEIVTEPGAVVFHRPNVAGRAFVGKHFRYGRGSHQFRAHHPWARKPEAPSFYLGLIRRGFAHGARVAALIGAAQILTALGFVWDAVASRSRPALRQATAPWAPS